MPPEPPTRRRVLRGVALGGGDVVLGAEGLFVRRGELVASGVEDVAVHPKATTSYPESDALHLDEGPEVVYVYLRVEDLATDREFWRHAWSGGAGRRPWPGPSEVASSG